MQGSPSLALPPLNSSIPTQSIVGIDFLRGALAILVLLGHSIDATLPFSSESGESVPVFWQRFECLCGKGAIWVFGFFVISGFCIQLSVNRSIAEKRFDIGRYLFARFTRIYPLYLIGLVVAVAAWLFGAWIGQADSVFPWSQLSRNLFIVQGFAEPFTGYRPSWSITNEFVYYLALPFVLVLARFRPGRAIALGIAVNLAIAALVIMIWKQGGESRNWLIPFWTVPTLSVLWFAGAFVAEYWERIQSSPLSRWFPALAVPLLVVTYVSYSWLNARNAPASVTYLHSYFSIAAFVCLILASARMPWLNRPGIARFCAWLGMLSYPLYLFHAPVQAALQSLFQKWDFGAPPGCLLRCLFHRSTCGHRAGRCVPRAILSRQTKGLDWLLQEPVRKAQTRAGTGFASAERLASL